MKNLSQITCGPEQAKELVELGITPVAFMWNGFEPAEKQVEGEPTRMAWAVAVYRKPVFSDELVPAWTKQELDAMIGPDIEKPDLFKKDQITKATLPETYPLMLPDKMLTFTNGARASAAALTYLLKVKYIDPVKVNERYLKMFP